MFACRKKAALGCVACRPIAHIHSSVIQELATHSAADVLEAQGRQGALIGPEPIWRPMKMCGLAFTVRSKEMDNLALHRAVAESSPGSVLVLDVTGTNARSRAMLGDVMAYSAKLRGIQGLVTNGVVRDFDRLRELDFPVYCTGFNIVGPSKSDPGELEVEICVGGATIRPGDVVLGDSDGCVVVKADTVERFCRLCGNEQWQNKKCLRNWMRVQAR